MKGHFASKSHRLKGHFSLFVSTESATPIFQLNPNCANGWNPVIGQGDAAFTRATSANFAAICAADLGGFPVGTIRTADIDELIIELEGGLLEGEAENKITYSNDFSNAAWLKTDVTLDSSSVATPDGGSNATKVTKIGAGAKMLDSNIAQTGDIKTIWVRSVSGAGTVGLFRHKDSPGRLYEITEDWQRFSQITDLENPDIIGEQHFYAVDFRGATTLTEVLLWQADLVALPFPTSPIYTEGTPVTRAASNLTYDAAGNFNPALFSIECEFSLLGLDSSGRTAIAYVLASSSINDHVGILINTDGTIEGRVRDTSTVDIIIGDVLEPFVNYKALLVGDKANNYIELFLDGVSQGVSIFASTPNNKDEIRVGALAVDPSNMYGHIKSLKIFDYDITNPDVFYISSLFKNGEDGAWFNMSKD